MKTTCTAPDCSRVTLARQLCQRHYARWYRYGRITLATAEEKHDLSIKALDARRHGGNRGT